MNEHETGDERKGISIETLLDIVMHGQIEALRILLPKYKGIIDLNQKDEYGNFVAILAAKKNNLEMLELFVEFGAGPSLDPGFKDGLGRNVIGWASKHKNERMKHLVVAQTLKNSSRLDDILDGLSQGSFDEIEKLVCRMSIGSDSQVESSPTPTFNSAPPIKGH